MSTAKTTTDSTAIQFLQFVWDHVQERTGHSWLKLNHAMREALELAVKSGMSFGLNDWEIIAKRFRSGYWVGSDTEWFYKLAVVYRHAEAYRAYEHSHSRKPFIVHGAAIHIHTGDGVAGGGLARLIVGAQFDWNGERVTLSSFNDEKGTVTACSYKQEPLKSSRCNKCGETKNEWGEKKLLHRYTISHADLAAARKAVKA